MNATRAAQAASKGEPFNAPSTPHLPACHLRLAITEGILDRRTAGDLQAALKEEYRKLIEACEGRTSGPVWVRTWPKSAGRCT